MEIDLNLTKGILRIIILVIVSSTLIITSSLHPIVIALIIIVVASAVGLYLSSAVSIWSLLALLLVFLGGIIVIFSYITTLASNDKLSLSLPSTRWPLVLTLAFVTFSSNYPLPSNNYNLGLVYSITRGSIILFLTLYLLFTLLVVVKITQAHKGALSFWK